MVTKNETKDEMDISGVLNPTRSRGEGGASIPRVNEKTEDVNSCLALINGSWQKIVRTIMQKALQGIARQSLLKRRRKLKGARNLKKSEYNLQNLQLHMDSDINLDTDMNSPQNVQDWE